MERRDGKRMRGGKSVIGESLIALKPGAFAS